MRDLKLKYHQIHNTSTIDHMAEYKTQKRDVGLKTGRILRFVWGNLRKPHQGHGI